MLAGPEGVDWERRLDSEFDNIGAALRWAVETRDAETVVRLFGMWDTPKFLSDVNLMATFRWAADMVRDMPGASECPRYPDALALTGAVASTQVNQDLAVRRCNEALTAEQRLGTEPCIFVWLVLSNVALNQGHHDEAIKHAQQAVELSRARGEPTWLAQSLAKSALVHALQGDATKALPEAEEVVTLTRRLANPHIMTIPLAFAAFALGDSEPERALALARGALELIRPGERSLAWAMAGDLAARQGDQRGALEYFAKAIDDAHWLANYPGLGTMIGRAGDLLADSNADAAVLQGIGDALAPGYAHAAHTLAARQQAIATLDASLGAARREELYEEGKAMSLDDAVAYAHTAITRRLREGRP
jgi:tetratricopeptide (TPR) repeat protein